MTNKEIIQTLKIIETNRDILKMMSELVDYIPEFKIRNPYDDNTRCLKTEFKTALDILQTNELALKLTLNRFVNGG